MDTRVVSITIQLNGKATTLSVQPHWTLLQALREGINAYEVKDGCQQGDCGACAVLLDGVPVNSCLVLACQADGCEVKTVKGIEADPATAHLLEAFVNNGGAQCGYCTPGMIVVGSDVVTSTPDATREQIRDAISGNLCRCTGYTQIVDSIAAAAATAKRAEPACKGERS